MVKYAGDRIYPVVLASGKRTCCSNRIVEIPLDWRGDVHSAPLERIRYDCVCARCADRNRLYSVQCIHAREPCANHDADTTARSVEGQRSISRREDTALWEVILWLVVVEAGANDEQRWNRVAGDGASARSPGMLSKARGRRIEGSSSSWQLGNPGLLGIDRPSVHASRTTGCLKLKWTAKSLIVSRDDRIWLWAAMMYWRWTKKPTVS